MSRLHLKFMVCIAAVLVVVLGLSLYLNSHFVRRFYTYQKKQLLFQTGRELAEAPERRQQIAKAALAEYGIVVVIVEQSEDNERLNQLLRTAFLDRGLGIERYWLWEEDYEQARSAGHKLRIYQQPSLNYSLLVEYVDLGDCFAGLALVLPNTGELLTIVNGITVLVMLAAVFVMLGLLYFLIGRILRPLAVMGAAAEQMGKGAFHKLELKTGDELEILAKQMNRMGSEIAKTQARLVEKNVQMEELLRNVSHDLKTPVALIKAYGSGIRDGLDDGSFLETMLAQNARMEKLISRLLVRSKGKHAAAVIQTMDVAAVFERSLEGYRPMIQVRGIEICLKREGDLSAAIDEELTLSIFDNLLSNAIKYTADRVVKIELKEQAGQVRVSISNCLAAGIEPDPKRWWEPFYVGESSRSKELSGHGIGLAIVRAAAESQGAQCHSELNGSGITFHVIFPKICQTVVTSGAYNDWVGNDER